MIGIIKTIVEGVLLLGATIATVFVIAAICSCMLSSRISRDEEKE